MTDTEKRDIALFRYGIISPLEAGTIDPTMSNNDFYRQASKKSYKMPNGDRITVSESTIEKWHLAYRKGGIDALYPQERSDAGSSRKLTPDLQEKILSILEKYPRITAVAIYRELQIDGSIAPGQISVSPVERFVRSARKNFDSTDKKDMRRYERAHINEVWYGDTCYGPYLTTPEGKKRIFIMILLDDASRFIVGADIFFSDSFENFMTVMRSAVTKYGRPRLFTFDNGSTYKNKQMELLTARIGSAVHYCEPFTPTGKAKIERLYGTVRSQFLAKTDMKDFNGIEELRTSFAEYVAGYNRTVHSSLSGMSPQDRFFSEPEQIHRLTQEQLASSFLLEVERRVSADCVVKINNTEYEVETRYAKEKIRLRYSPDMKTVYVVGSSGELTPIKLLNKQDNAVTKRERVRLSEGGDEAD